ncbi:lysyl oxidase family protein [Natrinema salinisoli]|uniref:lysyl oxidase family protein n=1 Tax=Natrinema salinisoli TaxID=2878535 RepID=UPI001CF0C1C1|nr:lysyl oxidase family protein [Natrinema salinisoli]
MDKQWTKGTKGTTILIGLLIVVAGVGVIVLGGITADNPFTESDTTDSSTTDGSEGTADEGAIPADEENLTTANTTTESNPEPSDEQIDDRSGANFVPGVGNFSISTEVFNESSPDVADGFVTPGEHKLLRFDMIIYNLGDEDSELGRPESRPDVYEYSDSHDHPHLREFNNYTLFNESGEEVVVKKKQAFCLRDNVQIRPNASSNARFDCEYQGISAGWADVYSASLPGQYLVIDDLPDGEYTLQATTNAEGTVDETCDGDNTVWVTLRIKNDTVTDSIPEDQYMRSSTC